MEEGGRISLLAISVDALLVLCHLVSRFGLAVRR